MTRRMWLIFIFLIVLVHVAISCVGLVHAGEFDEFAKRVEAKKVLGRGEAIKAIIKTLSQNPKDKPHVLMVGDVGMGQYEVVQGVQYALSVTEVCGFKNALIYEVDAVEFMDSEHVAKRLASVFSKKQGQRTIIFYVRDFQLWHPEAKKALLHTLKHDRPKIIIGTTPEGLNHVGVDFLLEFPAVDLVQARSENGTVEYLEPTRQALEQKYKSVRIPKASVRIFVQAFYAYDKHIPIRLLVRGLIEAAAHFNSMLQGKKGVMSDAIMLEYVKNVADISGFSLKRSVDFELRRMKIQTIERQLGPYQINNPHIWTRIRAGLSRAFSASSEKMEGPVVFGFFGAKGSGKSHAAKVLSDYLAQRPDTRKAMRPWPGQIERVDLGRIHSAQGLEVTLLKKVGIRESGCQVLVIEGVDNASTAIQRKLSHIIREKKVAGWKPLASTIIIIESRKHARDLPKGLRSLIHEGVIFRAQTQRSLRGILRYELYQKARQVMHSKTFTTKLLRVRFGESVVDYVEVYFKAYDGKGKVSTAHVLSESLDTLLKQGLEDDSIRAGDQLLVEVEVGKLLIINEKTGQGIQVKMRTPLTSAVQVLEATIDHVSKLAEQKVSGNSLDVVALTSKFLDGLKKERGFLKIIRVMKIWEDAVEKMNLDTDTEGRLFLIMNQDLSQTIRKMKFSGSKGLQFSSLLSLLKGEIFRHIRRR